MTSGSFALRAFDREINGFRYIAPNAIAVAAGSKVFEADLLSIRCGDKVAVRVRQFINDFLVAVILLDLRLQCCPSQFKRY